MDAQVTFKPGDRVRKKDGRQFSNGEYVVTVEAPLVWGDITPKSWLKETQSWIEDGKLELDDPWGAGMVPMQDQAVLAAASADPITSIVNKPSHYTKWEIEPITFIMKNGFDFWRGNIIKYASRAGSKLYDGMDAVQSEITDLEKVRRYAEMRINQLKGESIL